MKVIGRKGSTMDSPKQEIVGVIALNGLQFEIEINKGQVTLSFAGKPELTYRSDHLTGLDEAIQNLFETDDGRFSINNEFSLIMNRDPETRTVHIWILDEKTQKEVVGYECIASEARKLKKLFDKETA